MFFFLLGVWVWYWLLWGSAVECVLECVLAWFTDRNYFQLCLGLEHTWLPHKVKLLLPFLIYQRMCGCSSSCCREICQQWASTVEQERCVMGLVGCYHGWLSPMQSMFDQPGRRRLRKHACSWTKASGLFWHTWIKSIPRSCGVDLDNDPFSTTCAVVNL